MKTPYTIILILVIGIPAIVLAQSGSDAKAWIHVMGYSGGTGYGDDKEVRLVFPESSRLTGIRVRAPDVVRAIEFTFEDSNGKRQKQLVGSAGKDSDWQAPFVVPQGVRLVGISGTREVALDSLRFHLSDGTVSPEYGGPGGHVAFNFSLTKREGKHRGRVTGFFGRAGKFVIGGGLLYSPN